MKKFLVLRIEAPEAEIVRDRKFSRLNKHLAKKVYAEEQILVIVADEMYLQVPK